MPLRAACRPIPLISAAVLAGTLIACGAAHSSAGSGTTATSRTAPPAPTSQVRRAARRFERGATSLYASVLHGLASTPAVGNYYADGVWHADSACWRCQTEMGTVAAVISRERPAGVYRRWAIETFDALIRNHQQPNGAFGPPASGDQISTGAELVTMGTAYLELEPVLSRAVRARWKTAIRRAARWLTPDLSYYVNGNINLQETVGMYVAWRVTGDAAFYRAYDRSWKFTLRPGRRWPGFGLKYTRAPKKTSGADGAAYLAEKGPTAMGYDPHYTILQSDYASNLYALSGEPRVLRLSNLLMNQLLKRIDRHTLVIQTGSGSRNPQPHISGNFVSAVLPVLALTGGRSDLLRNLPRQLVLARGDFSHYVVSGEDQDQIIGNYVVSLLALKPPKPGPTPP